MANENCAIILAGGEGKRMQSCKPKVLSQVLFEPMLKWVIDAVVEAKLTNLCVVSGFMHECVDEYLVQLQNQHPKYQTVTTAFQAERKGTAHAVMMADSFLQAHKGGHVLILNGDAPLIDVSVIEGSYKHHIESENSVTVVAATLPNPQGYGRVVRDIHTGDLKRIVEQKDADPKTLEIHEVNSGIYWFSVDALLSVLYSITCENAQGEYYLPDAVKLLIDRKQKTGAYITDKVNTVLGANDCMQLNELNVIARQELLQKHMENGVEIPCTDGVMIGPDVTLGKWNKILPSTLITGKTSIGNSCVLGPNTTIMNTTIGSGIELLNVACKDCSIGDDETIAPFSVIVT